MYKSVRNLVWFSYNFISWFNKLLVLNAESPKVGRGKRIMGTRFRRWKRVESDNLENQARVGILTLWWILGKCNERLEGSGVAVFFFFGAWVWMVIKAAPAEVMRYKNNNRVLVPVIPVGVCMNSMTRCPSTHTVSLSFHIYCECITHYMFRPKQRQCTYNVILRCVHKITIAVKKQ